MKKPIGIVYLLTNTVNNLMYVGATQKTLQRRWYLHCSFARRGKTPINVAIRQYGPDAFICRVIDHAPVGPKLDALETTWIFLMNSFAPHGYNHQTGGKAGYKQSLEYRRKKSAAAKKQWQDSTHRKKISDAAKKQWAKANPVLRQRMLVGLKQFASPPKMSTRKRLI